MSIGISIALWVLPIVAMILVAELRARRFPDQRRETRQVAILVISVYGIVSAISQIVAYELRR